ncbi:MAG: LysR family transcriptional regulator [Hyphomicrobiales bacterium]|nr:LysR family transcriptional regulator [Hyphomicrobiales bacterium]MCP5370807.1 LysR family transcriptional regulator [Hyphomicrobiales bacterium]
MFGLRDAEIVSEVARARGFRAAATALGVAPSAVSARIAQVERMLGARLFDRSQRRARLTPVGRRFLEQVDRLLALRDEIADDITAREGLSGTLRIGVAETIVHTGLPAMLRHLAEAAPRVRLELSVDVSEQLARALMEDEIDIAVLMNQWTPRGVRGTLVERVEIDWYAAPAVLPARPGAAAATALDLDFLAERAVITFVKGTPPEREVAQILADPRLPPTVVHCSSSLATMVHLTCDGFGVGTLPNRLVAGECADGRLRRIDFGPAMRLSALEFEMCYVNPAIEKFAAILTGAAMPPPAQRGRT